MDALEGADKRTGGGGDGEIRGKKTTREADDKNKTKMSVWSQTNVWRAWMVGGTGM